MDPRIGTKPLVTIMMTTYNRADFIEDAIQSVQNQTYKNWELLVLDDASADDTRAIVSKYAAKDTRITWLPTEQNLGITKNRNRGFEYANGTYIAVLDSDDTWCDTSKLDKQVGFLESHPDHVVVGTQASVIDSTGKVIGKFTYHTHDSEIRRRMLLRNQFTHSSILIRSSTLPAQKPYDESISIWEDYALLLKLGTKGKFANLSETLTCYRKHTSNITKGARRTNAKTHLQIIRKYRDSYPNYTWAVLKSYARILHSLFN